MIRKEIYFNQKAVAELSAMAQEQETSFSEIIRRITLEARIKWKEKKQQNEQHPKESPSTGFIH